MNMMTVKKISTLLTPLFCLILLILLLASLTALVEAQTLAPRGVGEQASAGSDGLALAPARFELEMQPGSETTVVINLDYHTARANAQPSRILASLNDWTIDQNGGLQFYKAGTQAGSASPWIIYSPSEVTVQPGQTHSIRVTISVPKDAAPGDHLAALVVEQRPDTIKYNRSARQMLVRFRMASMFYITVPQTIRRGTLENLQATAGPQGITITPTLRNEGNSAIRPLSSVQITDSHGRTVVEMAEGESLPVLGGSLLSKSLTLNKTLPPGTYTVKYRVDFQGNGKATEGITDLVVKEDITREPVASTPKGTDKPKP
jgi:methionine-rich copper-binding protein CopC